MTYEAGADHKRMRDEEAYERAFMDDCLIKMIHFGIVGYEYRGEFRGFPNTDECCPAQWEDEMCWECPITDTPYSFIRERLEETPEIIKRSFKIIEDQELRRQMEIAQSMYEDLWGYE